MDFPLKCCVQVQIGIMINIASVKERQVAENKSKQNTSARHAEVHLQQASLLITSYLR